MQPREPAQDPASSLFTLDLGTSSNYTRQTVIDTLMIDDYISRGIKLKLLASYGQTISMVDEDSLVLRLVWAIKGFYME